MSSRADDFLRLACLTYADADGPERWAEARQVLADEPELADAGIHVAAARADPDAVRHLLALDPGLARAEGGPFGWEPILYLAYSRLDPGVGEAAVIDTARALLQAGADPDAGFQPHGLPTPFTVLTGAFGEGEGGPLHQPRHPHSLALARVLLEAGADPNDGQTLYNRMFEPDDDHLVLLFEFGLGTGMGGPWRARMGDALDLPCELLRAQLQWAATHDLVARVQLLIDHDVDVRTPIPNGRAVTDLAARRGATEIVSLLVAAGAPRPNLTPAEALIAAALAGNEREIDRLVSAAPEVVEVARVVHPDAVLDAVTAHRPDAVVRLVALGFDVNARARPGQGWVVDSTALHHAAIDGDLELCRRLLGVGADPEARDAAHDATPLGWARYGGQAGAVALLEPLTSEGAT
jgi:ankyrin repeat protein